MDNIKSITVKDCNGRVLVRVVEHKCVQRVTLLVNEMLLPGADVVVRTWDKNVRRLRDGTEKLWQVKNEATS